jgi:hypothetical protein
MRNSCLTVALAELAKVGIRDRVIASGGKHLQVRWTAPGGQARMATVGCTQGIGVLPRTPAQSP